MTREKTISLTVTIGIHLLLILLLLFFYIKPVDQERYYAELGGVPVMFGNVADAGGDDEPFGGGNGLKEDIREPIESDPTIPNNIPNEAEITTKTEQTPIQKVVPEKSTKTTKLPTATQDLEKTVALEKEKRTEANKLRKEEIAKAEANRKAKVEAERKATEEANRKKNINSQIAGLFGNGSGNGSRGNSQGQGTQGSPSGNGNSGKVSGVGGTGTYDLGGRGIGSGGLKLPAYTVDDYGTVVVDIIVDPKGNVIESSIGKGTNTTNSTLRNESLRAARQTKFSVVNSTNNQKGTITYKFNLN